MELFIKRFIDLLDEVIPVTMVHTITEQPLGAVFHDYYIKMHARLALADEDSPYVEIELYPYNQNELEALLAYTYPKEGISISEQEFVELLTQDKAITAEKIIALDDQANYLYEAFQEIIIDVSEVKAEIDQQINQVIIQIKKCLTFGGYEQENEE